MRTIHTLPDHVVSQIAAGEVIERPVYAVKELIENAIDAEADTITIQIEESGLKKIVVSDNGKGMSKEDLLESFKSHTTSKIKEDLVGISTLGFRGEALSSIAAISNIVIQARLASNTAGYRAKIKAGKLEDIGPIGMPSGTTITVSNLFHTVPARKKFLKSARTEFRHIVALVTQFALAYPEIRFLLTHNKRVILDLPKNQPLQMRIEKLLGKSFYSQLIPIEVEDSFIDISGFLARPQLTTRTQSKQFIFVNRRIVGDRVITSAVKEAYGNLLDSTSQPVFVFFVKLPSELVDINVHPRKEQIKFINSGSIFEEVKRAVQYTFAQHNITFFNVSFNGNTTRAGTTHTYAADLIKNSSEPWSVKDIAKITDTSQSIQLHNVYLLLQTKQGIILIDQHAAHERILYEQFIDEFKKQKKNPKVFKLQKPILVELSFSDGEILAEHQQILKNLGFSIDHVGDSTCRVKTIPSLFRDRDLQELVTELLEQIGEEKGIKDIDYKSNVMISYLACRAAIKAGEKLTKDEAKRLVEKLEKTDNNATCPHGRPTRIEFSLSQLHTLFKRV